MAQWLSDLGRLCAYRARRVLLAWLAIVCALGILIAWSSPQLSNNFAIPGTQAQEGLDTLTQRFPDMNGATAQLLLTSDDGSPITDHQQRVEEYLTRITRELPRGSNLTSPWSQYLRHPAISPDQTAALVTIQFPFSPEEVDPSTRDILNRLSLQAPKSVTVSAGGPIYQTTSVPLSVMEVIGVGVAFLTLLVTLRSIRAAITPLVTALIGTAAIVALIVLSALWFDISTTTPTLAVMISLAVGIDYALFIVTRHQRQMSAGMPTSISIPLANATAGSAVIYAAATVVIALSALSVTGIPFLALMGISAAVGVVTAAISAVTALPALLSLLGERILPRSLGSRAHEESLRLTFSQRWAQKVTAHPVVALISVIIIVLTLALPTPLMRLSLPDNGVEAPGTNARETYDAIEKTFGPGANAPLLIIGDIIHSTDPLALMETWAQVVEETPGVAHIQLAVPNRHADLGVLVVIPTTASTDSATADTVQALRTRATEWSETLDIDNIRVTGITAAQIDITHRLSTALIPFSIVVVALALVILTLVFHSIWIPLSAALGYLLSVAAAFGVTAAVFHWQPLNDLLLIGQVGPVICFMPIIVVGVLFGLAMDYQVFVVTAIQEEWLKGIDTRQSIINGLGHSGTVVTAAAFIMVSVFTGFIPHGSFSVQPIAIGLAAGVAVDAFLIRMTAIPALLTIMGRHAWWCPRFLTHRLPHLAYGEEAINDVTLTSLEDPNLPPPLLVARGIVVDNHAGRRVRLLDFDIFAGECIQFDSSALVARQMLRIVSGLSRPQRGSLTMNLDLPGEDRTPKRTRVGFIYDRVGADLVVKDVGKKSAAPCLAVDIPLSEDDLRALHAVSAQQGGCLILGPLMEFPSDLVVRTIPLENTPPRQARTRSAAGQLFPVKTIRAVAPVSEEIS